MINSIELSLCAYHELSNYLKNNIPYLRLIYFKDCMGNFISTYITKAIVTAHIITKCRSKYLHDVFCYSGYMIIEHCDVLNHANSTVCSIFCSGAHHRNHQTSASLAFVRGKHRWPVSSPPKGPVPWTKLPNDDIIMYSYTASSHNH